MKEYVLASIGMHFWIFIASIFFGLWIWSFSAAFWFLIMATVVLRVWAYAVGVVILHLDRIARK